LIAWGSLKWLLKAADGGLILAEMPILRVPVLKY
jgi:hypothetical protein